jgi:hypothetical protein
MSRQPPPHDAVQPADERSVRRRGHRVWLALAWAASLIVVAGGVYLFTARGLLAPSRPDQMQQMRTRNDKLRQRVTMLSRSLQVAQVASHSLQDTLAAREEKINGLRSDLAFYSHLIGGGAQHHGLRIQDVHLTPVGDSRAWNLTITLTHNVKRDSEVKGAVKVAIEGILDGHLTRIPWRKLSGDDEAKGLDFAFRYFQQVRGTLMLPEGFTPNHVRVQAQPTKGKAVVTTVDWSDALKTVTNNHPQP